MKLILPCAGLGTRVGMKPNEAKELMVVENECLPIIEWALDLAAKTYCEPVIISRKEKKEFNSYLKKRGIKPLIIKPEGEWMDSVLASFKLWDEDNILVLPDTRFDNQYNAIDNVKFSLREIEAPLVLGMHKVDDVTKWCVKFGNYLVEKPKSSPDKWAFGIIGFKESLGIKLFECLSQNKESYLPSLTQYLKLTNFRDLTRGDYKLKKYVDSK